MIARLLPNPVVTLVITLLWLVIVSRFTFGSLVMGLVVGLLVPLYVQAFWTERPVLRRPLLALKLLGRVLLDIVTANIEVARLVLGPTGRLHPAFLRVPLDLESPYVATIFGSIMSLTPGTVSVEIDMEAREVLVHALNAPDPDAIVATVKRRYEAPLKEIFGC
ncbi:MAG: Na+/H+ antiporter subunit E [Sphingomonadaceae bacterium]